MPVITPIPAAVTEDVTSASGEIIPVVPATHKQQTIITPAEIEQYIR